MVSSLQLISAMRKSTTRRHDSVVRGYQYVDRWEPTVGDKFTAEIEESIPRPILSGGKSVKVQRGIVGDALTESIGKNAVKCLLG